MAIDPLAISSVHRAYSRLLYDELVLFLKVRNLPTSGTHEELASRLANHDIHTYHFQHQPRTLAPSQPPAATRRIPDLPVEIVADILDLVGDWELTQHLGVPTSLTRPACWQQASATDAAIISGSIKLVWDADPQTNPPTRLGAILAIRFGFVHLLEFFMTEFPRLFLSMFKMDLIPIKASRYGRTNILSWWRKAQELHPDMIPPAKPESLCDAIDSASRNCSIASLDWWRHSGLPLHYSETSLEAASSRNHIPVLDWWKHQHKESGLPLKVGRVMDMASTAGHVDVLEWWATSQIEFKYGGLVLHHASCHGRLDVLRWWLGSGLQLIFDADVLTGATRYNRPEVLEWWDNSGLPIEYRVCDIEEALEDAPDGNDAARAWWKQKGVDFNANDKDWMKVRTLN